MEVIVVDLCLVVKPRVLLVEIHSSSLLCMVRHSSVRPRRMKLAGIIGSRS